MRLPTLDHVFYIPLILAVGAALGYWWGRRALRITIAEQERIQRQRAERRAQRRAELAVQTAAENDDLESESSAP